MKVRGAKVLVTGGSRGLGKALINAFQEAGASKIYAGSRVPKADGPAGVISVRLDITNTDQVAAAALRCQDIDILVNNAGVACLTPALGAPSMDNARLEMETNYFGTLAMCRAFAPILKKNGGGAIVNVLSVVSWFNMPMQATYCASKSAAWSLTKAVRFELRAQGTFVAGVYAGYIATDMTTDVSGPKSSPQTIAEQVLLGLQNHEEEILADERAKSRRAELLGDYRPFEETIQKMWDEFKAGRSANP